MKKYLCAVPLALLLCFTFACQNKAEKAELEKFRTQAKVEEQNMALVKQANDAWSQGNLEAYRGYIAPKYLYYSPSISAKPMSIGEVFEMGNKFRGAFPDINWKVEELIASGDKVILRYVLSGTHQGEFQGIPATGNKVEASGITIIRIENRKFVEEKEEFDMLGFMTQLGMELKPKEKEKK
jgi:steroid delta-isomerase-like uncharacterized protein